MKPVLRAVVHGVIRALPARTALPILTGPLRGARWLVRSCNAGCWAGVYERENQQLLARLLHPGDHFVDVGANVGFFTLLGARRVGVHGRVLAVEPLEANLEFLRCHVELNGADNVVILPRALAERSGTGSFSHQGSPSQARLDPLGAVTVAVDTLDDALERVGWRSVRVVKIDVEGAEARVLEGARRTLTALRPPGLLVATHGWRAHRDCLRLLSGYGVQVVSEIMDEPSGNGTILTANAA